MTVSQRLDWAKRLVIVQVVLNAALVLVGMIAGASFVAQALSMGSDRLLGFAVPALFAVFAGLLLIVLPLIVLHGLNKKTKEWGVAIYALLVYQTVAGGGFLSILPLITLILLFDGEIFHHLTADQFRGRGFAS